LRCGACALGVGGALVSSQAVADGDMASIESLAQRYVDIVKNFRDSTD